MCVCEDLYFCDMIRYKDIQNNERRLLGLTSLKSAEFEHLLTHFSIM